MNKRLLKYLIYAVLAVAIAVLILVFGRPKANYRLDKLDLSEIPGINAADWTKSFKTSPLPHILLQKTNTDIKKYVFSTADCGIIKHGYINRVEIFIVFDHQGKVENIILGKNIETPKLIKKMRQSGFFQQWSNSKPQKIQYVTGATSTSKAVDEGVTALCLLLKREKFFK